MESLLWAHGVYVVASSCSVHLEFYVYAIPAGDPCSFLSPDLVDRADVSLVIEEFASSFCAGPGTFGLLHRTLIPVSPFSQARDDVDALWLAVIIIGHMLRPFSK